MQIVLIKKAGHVNSIYYILYTILYTVYYLALDNFALHPPISLKVSGCSTLPNQTHSSGSPIFGVFSTY